MKTHRNVRSFLFQISRQQLRKSISQACSLPQIFLTFFGNDCVGAQAPPLSEVFHALLHSILRHCFSANFSHAAFMHSVFKILSVLLNKSVSENQIYPKFGKKLTDSSLNVLCPRDGYDIPFSSLPCFFTC